MKTTTDYYTTFKCDHGGCDAEYRSPSMPSWARKQARKLGWVRVKKLDYCSKHDPSKKRIGAAV